MPNISLGQQQQRGSDGTPLTEAELRARMAVHHGMPLTQHMMTGPLPYYPAPPLAQHPPGEYISGAHTLSCDRMEEHVVR